MGISFALLFPFGSIIIRFLTTLLPVPLKLHYSTQLFSFLAVIIATILGIYASDGMQFIYFRTSFFPRPFLTGRPSFWHYSRRIDICPSWIWVLSPSPFCKRPSDDTSMVYTHASVARSVHYSWRFGELWMWTCSCLCRSDLCIPLVDNLWPIGDCLCSCFTDAISV